MISDTIQRFNRKARLTHWLIASSGFVLLGSGFAHLPPLHLPAAALFIGSILTHVISNLVRRDYSILPIGNSSPEQRGKFLAEQRRAHTALGIVALLLIGSGILLFIGNAADLSEDVMALVVAGWAHRLAAFGFAAWVILHVGALLLPHHRPLLGAMFSGTVARRYAQLRYPDWASSPTSKHRG